MLEAQALETLEKLRRQTLEGNREMFVLGIDIGTSGTRALVIDGKGCVITSATEEHAPFTSPKVGWAEQNRKIGGAHAAWLCARHFMSATLQETPLPALALLAKCTGP